MSSNLTGQFIANTFQNLLQIDSGNTSNSTTILNGLGQVKTSVAIDSNSDSNGGLFIKDGQGPGRVMGIQYVNANDGEGLNFWTPGSINANLFLKRTGTTWVGYNSGGSVVVDPDVATYSLYVRDGVQVGENNTGYNGRINLIGANPLENGAGMFINGEYPMTVRRFRAFNINTEDSRSFFIREFDYSPVDGRLPNADFLCMVVGFEFIRQNNNSGDLSIIKLQAEPNLSTGFWIVDIRMRDDGGSINLGQVFVDVLIIKKGLFIVDTSKFTTPYAVDFDVISTPEPI
jgi:hypothetical protein